jgi:acyl carrier protein
LDTGIIGKLTHFISSEILKQPNRIINPEAELLSSGLIDSFNLVDLALYIEDEFGVHIDDSELNSDSFDTILQLVGIINSRQK